MALPKIAFFQIVSRSSIYDNEAQKLDVIHSGLAHVGIYPLA
jgi:hypothetical protein